MAICLFAAGIHAAIAALPHARTARVAVAAVVVAFALARPVGVGYWDSDHAPVERFMAESRPERVWYVGFRTGGTEAQVVEAIEAQGCSTHAVRETRRGRLYRAECR